MTIEKTYETRIRQIARTLGENDQYSGMIIMDEIKVPTEKRLVAKFIKQYNSESATNKSLDLDNSRIEKILNVLNARQEKM